MWDSPGGCVSDIANRMLRGGIRRRPTPPRPPGKHRAGEGHAPRASVDERKRPAMGRADSAIGRTIGERLIASSGGGGGLHVLRLDHAD